MRRHGVLESVLCEDDEVVDCQFHHGSIRDIRRPAVARLRVGRRVDGRAGVRDCRLPVELYSDGCRVCVGRRLQDAERRDGRVRRPRDRVPGEQFPDGDPSRTSARMDQ